MALPATFESIDQVPEPFREMYEFVSGTSGPVRLSENYTDLDKLNGALNNERTERTARQQRIDQMSGELKAAQEKLGRFEGIDPAGAKTALEELEKLKEERAQLEQERLASEGKHAEAAELKFRNALLDAEHKYQAEVDARKSDQEQIAKLTGQLSKVTIDERLSSELNKQHVREEMIPHLLATLREPWRLEGEEMLPNAYQGDQPMYGKDQERITMEEYVSNFLTTSPWAVRESVGGGVVQNGQQANDGTWTVGADQFSSLDQYEKLRDKVLSGDVNIVAPNA